MQETENDILKRVRKIEIKTRGLSNEIFAGKYHTAFRGRGMSFSEVREYRAGDDVRDIDWNVTARSRPPHTHVYEGEGDYFYEDRSDSIIDDDTLARLLLFPNVIVTSHQAFFTAEAMHNITETTLQNIKDFFDGRPRVRALAPLLVKLVYGFVGNSVDTAFQTVGSVFLRTAFRDINGVFRFFFGLDKGGFHTLGGNRRFINRFDRAFQSIPCLNIRHRKPPFQAPVDALK